MSLRLATVLTPICDEHLAWAAQLGLAGVVVRYPGDSPAALEQLCMRIRGFGLEVVAVEGYLPIERAKLGLPGSEADLAAMSRLITWMGELKIPLLCYNFMGGSDWTRTSTTTRERGGALVTAFRAADVPLAVRERPLLIQPEAVWDQLDRLLRTLLPVAERAQVKLAMHPDDPPVAQLNGYPRIMRSVADFDRLLEMHPSASNTICFCQGTFAEMGVEIPATIRHFGRAISYVHCRDVRGTCADFVETFQDNGQTDMAAAMRAYREIGFAGPMRPDHVPQLAGEESGEAGYTMLGRLYAFGYLRGLYEAAC